MSDFWGLVWVGFKLMLVSFLAGILLFVPSFLFMLGSMLSVVFAVIILVPFILLSLFIHGWLIVKFKRFILKGWL